MAKNSRGIGVKIGICLLMAVQFTQGLVSPGLAAMQAAFPDSPVELVQSLSTVATLFMFASIFVGPGVRRLGYKKMTVITVVLMFIGAIGVALIGATNFWGVFVCRIVYGIGYGFAFALCVAYCAALYEGKERSSMLGIMTGVGGFASIVFSYIAGVLSGIDWTLSFYFMAAFVVVVGGISLILLPEPAKVEEAPAAVESKDARVKSGYPASFWVLLIGAIFGIAAFTSFMNNAAMVIIGTGMGDGQAIGTVFSFFGIGLMVGAFAYAPVKSLFKRFTHPLILILFAIAFIGLTMSPDIMLLTCFAVVHGFAFGMLNPCWSDLLLDKAKGNGANVSSLFVATQGLGQFFSPTVIGFAATAVGLTGVYYQWQLVWPCLCVVAVVVLVLNAVGAVKKGADRSADSVN